MRVLIAIAALAGCYEPDVTPCLLKCATVGDPCPDGLVCNAQNLCAAGVKDECESSVVTIRVVDGVGDPVPGVRVSFADRTGAVIDEVPTDTDGFAFSPITAGSSATVFHPTPTGAVETYVTTFLDLPPGAHIISQPFLDVVPVTVTVGMPGQSANDWELRASCMGTTTTGPASTPSTQIIMVPRRCKEGDVIAIAHANGTSYASVTSTAFPPGGFVMTGDWQPMSTFTATTVNVPEVAAAFAQLHASLDPDHLLSTAIGTNLDLAQPSSFLLPSGSAPVLGFVTSPLGTVDDVHFQLETVRLAPGEDHAARDFAEPPLLLPWPTKIETLLDERAVRWTAVNPTTGSEPADIVVANMRYTRNGQEYVWRVVAPAGYIVDADPQRQQRELRLPDLPGDPEFMATDPKPTIVDLLRTVSGDARSLYEQSEVATQQLQLSGSADEHWLWARGAD